MLKRYWPVLFVLYMSFVGGNYLAYNLALPIRVGHHVIVTAILVYWFLKHGLPNSPMLIPAAAMLGAVGLSVATAMDQRMALENAWHWFINLGLFLVLIDWFRRGYGSLLFGGAFASVGALAGSSILQGVLMPGTRVGGLFGIVNLTGGYTAAQTIPALGWTSMVQSRKAKLLLLGLVAAQLLTLYLNESRGALLSFGVAALSAFIPLILKRLKIGVLAIPLLVLVVGGVGAWSANPAHSSGDKLRMDLWEGAGQMIDARPLTGVGVGLFGQVYREITTQLGRPDADGATGAHNLYLNLAAELGGVGLAAGAGMLLTVVYLLTKTQWNLSKLTVLAGLVGILAHMLVDNFPTQNYTFLVSLYVAYLIHDHRVGFQSKAAARAVVVGALLFGLVMLQYDRAQYWYERSLGGDIMAAMYARDLDPGLNLYHLNVVRIDRGMDVIRMIDPTIKGKTQLGLYGLVKYGRYW
jgi:O-antigen ligase